MDIRQNIAELLIDHDCVIIPGFGGFIGNRLPARIDPVSHTFHPPTKSLLFNINLVQNDGLLANSVSNTFAISYAEACRTISEFTEHARSVLNAGRILNIPGIGELNAAPEGIIQFSQDPATNLHPGSFGLPTLVSPPVLRTLRLPAEGSVIPAQGTSYQGPRYILPRTLKRAAVLALPLGIAAVIGFTQYDRISTGLENNAGMLTSVFSRFSYSSASVRKTAPAMPPRTFLIPKIAEAPVPAPAQVRPVDRFAIIVGAFRFEENASKYVDELKQKGINASVYDRSRTGLYRVTIGTCPSRNEALALLATARDREMPGAWILAK